MEDEDRMDGEAVTKEVIDFVMMRAWQNCTIWVLIGLLFAFASGTQ